MARSACRGGSGDTNAVAMDRHHPHGVDGVSSRRRVERQKKAFQPKSASSEVWDVIGLCTSFQRRAKGANTCKRSHLCAEQGHPAFGWLRDAWKDGPCGNISRKHRHRYPSPASRLDTTTITKSSFRIRHSPRNMPVSARQVQSRSGPVVSRFILFALARTPTTLSNRSIAVVAVALDRPELIVHCSDRRNWSGGVDHGHGGNGHTVGQRERKPRYSPAATTCRALQRRSAQELGVSRGRQSGRCRDAGGRSSGRVGRAADRRPWAG